MKRKKGKHTNQKNGLDTVSYLILLYAISCSIANCPEDLTRLYILLIIQTLLFTLNEFRLSLSNKITLSRRAVTFLLEESPPHFSCSCAASADYKSVHQFVQPKDSLLCSSDHQWVSKWLLQRTECIWHILGLSAREIY